ncbi:hypothetical protein [Burkholderia ubonensis]|nr:hypothetical protein [Burkholderia ubonensis]
MNIQVFMMDDCATQGYGLFIPKLTKPCWTCVRYVVDNFAAQPVFENFPAAATIALQKATRRRHATIRAFNYIIHLLEIKIPTNYLPSSPNMKICRIK